MRAYASSVSGTVIRRDSPTDPMGAGGAHNSSSSDVFAVALRGDFFSSKAIATLIGIFVPGVSDSGWSRSTAIASAVGALDPADVVVRAEAMRCFKLGSVVAFSLATMFSLIAST